VAQAIVEEKTRVIDLDLRTYFDNVQHSLLLGKGVRRVQDAAAMKLLKMILKATGKSHPIFPTRGVRAALLSRFTEFVTTTKNRSMRTGSPHTALPVAPSRRLPVAWKQGTTDTIEALPVRDSIARTTIS
jgi:hypothetical protein